MNPSTKRPLASDGLSATPEPAKKRGRPPDGQKEFDKYMEATKNYTTLINANPLLSGKPFHNLLTELWAHLQLLSTKSKEDKINSQHLRAPLRLPEGGHQGLDRFNLQVIDGMVKDLESLRKDALLKLSAILPSAAANDVVGLQANPVTQLRIGGLPAGDRIKPSATSIPFYAFCLLRQHFGCIREKLQTDEGYIECQEVATLCSDTLDFDYTAQNPHNQMVLKGLKALNQLIPDDDEWEWVHSPTFRKYGFDFARIRKADRYISCFGEVKSLDGKDGDPYIQACQDYNLYMQEYEALVDACGTPSLIVAIKDGQIGFGGAVYDSAIENGAVFDRLTGYINTADTEDLAQALYAFKHSLSLLESDVPVLDPVSKTIATHRMNGDLQKASLYGTIGALKDAPKVGLEKGIIRILVVLVIRILYRVKLNLKPDDQSSHAQLFRAHNLHLPDKVDKSYLLLMTYAFEGLGRSRAGKQAMDILSEKAYAPAYVMGFSVEHTKAEALIFADVKMESLIGYHLLEDLPEAVDGKPGWIDLARFGKQHQVAKKFKGDVLAALKTVIKLLRDEGFCHNSMTPDNVFIQIIIDSNGEFNPIAREDGSCAVDLKLLGFQRSQRVANSDFDRVTVDTWMKAWPRRGEEAFQAVKEGPSIRPLREEEV